ncbi:chaperonin GroEL [Pajaroellobacter abortibovis]|uniref:Chaperonin GroEL n=1 Tax=Pajaroellobacter abortibovis TaxID=1882918 RepID=A0A1L6MXA4_9BACT|nr:chaperonin GroEL [Pajaroellobacter abortibovis]APS00089.1 chaperonin GroL [Pajaroellobacter abortibovis]
MSAKQITYNRHARRAILRGVQSLAEAVRVTLGPKGRCVVIEKPFGSPEITKDGVTVVKQVELADKFQNMGAQMIREVASKINEKAGDGTTTATVLAHAIYAQGLMLVEAGHNPVDIKCGIDAAVAAVLANMKKNAVPTRDREHIAQVGTISANGDQAIGEIIADAMEKVGKEGVVTVEEASGVESWLEVVEGMQFDRGYVSPYFVTNAEKMSVELESPFILISEKKMSAMQELIPLLEQVVSQQRPLLILAEDVEGEALATLIINKLRGRLQVAVVKAPGFGERRKEILKDIAILTKGEVISDDLGMKLEHASLHHLGQARRVCIDRDNTTIIGGAGDPKQLKGRIEAIRKQIDTTTSEYDREKLQERLAKLTGGVAVIRVGSHTETEMKEKKARMEDALHATRAAVEEGVVVGGGVALLRASKALDPASFPEEHRDSVRIVQRALEEPLRQIAANAGMDGSVVVDHVLRREAPIGFNAQTEKYEDMEAAGIIDPVKVVRLSLEIAASVAGMMLTTEAAISEQPKRQGMDMDDAGMGGMGMGAGDFDID